MKTQLNDRELATVLAALRYWQDVTKDGAGPEFITLELANIGTNNAEFTPLSGDEIDALCERLNVSSPAMTLSEAEELKRGKMIVELLGLRKIREISKRRGIPIFWTSVGTKTELGLFRTVARVVLDGE